MANLEKTKTILATERLTIPSNNHLCFDAMVVGYLELMSDPVSDYKKLATSLWKAIKDMRRYDYSKTLPPLPRKLGETPDEYCDRLYRVAGWTKI